MFVACGGIVLVRVFVRSVLSAWLFSCYQRFSTNAYATGSFILLVTQISVDAVVVIYRGQSNTWSRSVAFMHCNSHWDSLCPVHTTMIQQEKCRQKDIIRMCRRQYLRAFCHNHACDSAFPETLVGFFSRFPGLRHFLGIKLALFSTAVDDDNMRVALAPFQNVFWCPKIGSWWRYLNQFVPRIRIDFKM